MLVATVPMLALGLGYGSLNVALNTLAVLFLFELDNIMFTFM